jgi:hypothetical protein
MAAVTWPLRYVAEPVVPSGWGLQAASVIAIAVLGTGVFLGVALILGVSETRRALAFLLHRK